jgi:uncharacterized protein (TIGR01777 family)
MLVAVTGASGFIGRTLLQALQGADHRVVALTRNPEAARFPPGVLVRRYDPSEPTAGPAAFDGVEVVVHLAGEPIAGRWTARKKHAIAASRIEGTRHLVAALAASAQRPRIFLCASAVGYYGSRGDEPLAESAAPGNDFLARVCVGWEAAAREAERLGIRTVMLRFGVVLGHGGALESMKLPFLLGLGGPIGSGKQYLPWIHVDDLAALCTFAIDRANVAGPFNVVAPDYATNARFAHALGAALRRPSFFPVPAFAMRALLGEFADTLLSSQLVVPAAAQSAGFVWTHPILEPALNAILRG